MDDRVTKDSKRAYSSKPDRQRFIDYVYEKRKAIFSEQEDLTIANMILDEKSYKDIINAVKQKDSHTVHSRISTMKDWMRELGVVKPIGFEINGKQYNKSNNSKFSKEETVFLHNCFNANMTALQTFRLGIIKDKSYHTIKRKFHYLKESGMTQSLNNLVEIDGFRYKIGSFSREQLLILHHAALKHYKPSDVYQAGQFKGISFDSVCDKLYIMKKNIENKGVDL